MELLQELEALLDQERNAVVHTLPSTLCHHLSGYTSQEPIFHAVQEGSPHLTQPLCLPVPLLSAFDAKVSYGTSYRR